MSVDAAERTQSVRPRYFNPCAQCGEALLAPEWSEHVNERCVRHVWTCDSCGYEFETMVYLELR
jgi:transcription elongation factor Elf1